MISYHTCPLATLGGKDTGGMNVYVRDLTRELGRRGFGVDVFTRSQDEHVPHVLHDLGYGNRIVHVPAGPETPMAKDRLVDYLPAFIDYIVDFATTKNIRYDILHSHYWLSGLAALELRARWGLPVIHMFHTLAAMKNRVARDDEAPGSTLRLEAEGKLLRQADRIVAATQAELAQFQWLYHVDTRRVAVIPPGVDTGHFYPIPADEAREFAGVPPEKRMLLFVGRVEPLKGIDSLLQAIAILRAHDGDLGRQLCLAVIGGEPGDDGLDETDEMSSPARAAQRPAHRRHGHLPRPAGAGHPAVLLLGGRSRRRPVALRVRSGWSPWKRWPAGLRSSPRKRAGWRSSFATARPASTFPPPIRKRWPSDCGSSCATISCGNASGARRRNTPSVTPGP